MAIIRESVASEPKRQPQVQEALIYLEKEICRLKELPEHFSNRLKSVLPCKSCNTLRDSSPETAQDGVELAIRIRAFTHAISEVAQDFENILASLKL